MATGTIARELLATVDVRELNSLRWGPIRQMFPEFVEEIELGRYLKDLLAANGCRPVQLEAHRQPNGTVSDHMFDVFLVAEQGQTTA
jgi:hypothetical protein